MHDTDGDFWHRIGREASSPCQTLLNCSRLLSRTGKMFWRDRREQAADKSSRGPCGLAAAIMRPFVDVFLGDRPERVRDFLAEADDGCLMAGEEPVCLDVEDEPAWRTFDPALRVFDARDAVVAAVDLDDGKLRGVEPEPFLGRRRGRRVEAAALDECLVSPRRSADENSAHLSRRTASQSRVRRHCAGGGERHMEITLRA
jgi:hypothetical protein